MRSDAKLWWEQAQQDLDAASKNVNIPYVAVFLCQQAVEKGLKALFIHTQQESPGTTHSLVYLASATKVPKKHMEFIRDLAPEFVATRYPDIADEAPYKLYSTTKAKKVLANAQEVMIWIQSHMQP